MANNLSLLQEPDIYYTERTFTYNVIRFYINGSIENHEAYMPLISKLQNADEMDEIHIHLNTLGGDISIGAQIINAMKRSNAKIVTHIDGQCFSLGTLIFLSSDEQMVSDYAIAMCHNFSSGTMGKGNEQIAELKATMEWFETMARNIYRGFLTDEEIESLFRGADIWMLGPEIDERLARLKTLELEPKELLLDEDA